MPEMLHIRNPKSEIAWQIYYVLESMYSLKSLFNLLQKELYYEFVSTCVYFMDICLYMHPHKNRRLQFYLFYPTQVQCI